jgi:ABC-type cobalamin/Fe3+-siderophores transport system ATPase subunit
LGAKVYGKVIKENNMPCRSYEDDYHTGPPTDSWQYKELKKINDRLARIACKAMTELVEQGKADFLVIRDDEVREWWDKHQEADRKAKEQAAEKRRINKLKKEALAKLSDEEKAVLGIKK